MANKKFWLGILAIALVFTMMAVGCDNGSTDNNNPKPIKFISTDTAGTTTYTLIITPKTPNAIAKDDSYVLTITIGQTNKVSTGTISHVTEGGALTMQPKNSGSQTFTITVTDSWQMTKIEGPITVGEGEGETVQAPGTVTPGEGSGGGGTAILDGTWASTNPTRSVVISGNAWTYSENGHEYSRGTWSSSVTPAASSTGTITFVVTHFKSEDSWVNLPAQYESVKTNTATFTINATGNTLTLSNPALTTAGVWGTLQGIYTKSGSSGGGDDVIIDGWTWSAYNDNDENEKGISTVTLTRGTGTDSNNLNISGNVALIPGKNYGFVHLNAVPNSTNLTALKNADSFSFKCKGDGKKYLLIVGLSNVTDFCFYEYVFTAPVTEQTLTVQYNDFRQPSWGIQVPFNKNNITRIQFYVRAESNITGVGTYNLTIWDLKAGGQGGNGNTAVTFSNVTANGSTSQTTTQLTLTFSQAITGLNASDITLSGVSGVSKGTLSGSGPTYTLPISGFTATGTLNVTVAKSGYTISGSPKTAAIYYSDGGGSGTLNGTWVNDLGTQWILTNGNFEIKEKFRDDPSYIWTSSKGTYTTSGTSITLTPTHQYELSSHQENNNPWVHTVHGGTRAEWTAYLKSPAGIEEYGPLTDAEITAGLNQIFAPVNCTYSLNGNTLSVTYVAPNGQSESSVFTRKS